MSRILVVDHRRACFTLHLFTEVVCSHLVCWESAIILYWRSCPNQKRCVARRFHNLWRFFLALTGSCPTPPKLRHKFWTAQRVAVLHIAKRSLVSIDWREPHSRKHNCHDDPKANETKSNSNLNPSKPHAKSAWQQFFGGDDPTVFWARRLMEWVGRIASCRQRSLSWVSCEERWDWFPSEHEGCKKYEDVQEQV